MKQVREPFLFNKCRDCPCWFDCKVFGCYAWNDKAREIIKLTREYERRPTKYEVK